MSLDVDNMTVSLWFQMGNWNGKYFDSFIHRSDYDSESLDRDKWLGFMQPQRVVMSTLPLRMRWEEVNQLIRDLRGSNLEGFWAEIPKYDHRLTRTFGQQGGFIRPRFFWEADIPSRHEAVHWGKSDFEGMPEFDKSAPRVVPSTAIKVKLRGVENLRLHKDCEAFYFQHSGLPVTGIYRRKLWPEPSEDPLYGLIWNQAILVMASQGIDELTAADDIDGGLLDRGYRVAGEKQTMDARELDDLMRGQLEDAREAVNGPQPSPRDWVCLSGGLVSGGDKRAGVIAALNAVRLDPFDVAAGLALAGALWQVGRVAWARRVLTKVELFAPDHPDLLFNIAVVEIEEGKYASAFKRLKTAIRGFDRSKHDLPRDWILERLLFVAEKLGETTAVSYARAALEQYHWTGGTVVDETVLEE
ncbi:MAG TPA: hypothetical protein VJT71_20110 [Pyrinomonadaceae bacterium]|nr:hypothetical protein [Pyrinomonadaceae bacterium]